MEAAAELNRIVANARLAAEHDVFREKEIQKETIELNADLRRAVSSVVEAAQQERRDLHKSRLGETLHRMCKAQEKPFVTPESRHNYVTLLSGVWLSLALLGPLARFSKLPSRDVPA